MYNVVIEVISMTTIAISEKGQLTLPVDVRKKLGIKPRSRMEVEVRDNEVVLRRVRSVEELHGIFAEYAIPGMTHEKEHEIMERAVAQEAMSD